MPAAAPRPHFVKLTDWHTGEWNWIAAAFVLAIEGTPEGATLVRLADGPAQVKETPEQVLALVEAALNAPGG